MAIKSVNSFLVLNIITTIIALSLLTCPTILKAGDKIDLNYWIKKAENGDSMAQCIVGQEYYLGRYVPKDKKIAAKWIEKSAEQGYEECQYLLGKIYYHGIGVLSNKEQAVKWLRKATEGSLENDAQYYLEFIESGQGLPQDMKEMANWLRKKAEKGNAKAQYMIGKMYLWGEGVPIDEKEWAKWNKKAALQGFPDAQFYIGSEYQSGHNTPRNCKKAIEWYEKAALQGHILALQELGLFYEEGKCIPKNLIRAYAWYNLLTVQKPEWEHFRDNIETEMTQSQIAKGQELSTNLAEGKINKTPPPNPPPQMSKKIKPKIAGTKPWILEKIPHTSHILPEMPGALSFHQLRPEDIFRKVKESIFVVLAAKSSESLKQGNDVLQGSAVAVSSRHLLTNCHVTKNRPFILVIQGEQKITAHLSGKDDSYDMCVLTVKKDKFTPVNGVRKFDKLLVGEKVYTVGAPIGLERTLGEGIISGLREHDKLKLIQTSAPISSGSSGGGLFDSSGNLLGITTFLFKDAQNLNFAIAAEQYWK